MKTPHDFSHPEFFAECMEFSAERTIQVRPLRYAYRDWCKARGFIMDSPQRRNAYMRENGCREVMVNRAWYAGRLWYGVGIRKQNLGTI